MILSCHIVVRRADDHRIAADGDGGAESIFLRSVRRCELLLPRQDRIVGGRGVDLRARRRQRRRQRSIATIGLEMAKRRVTLQRRRLLRLRKSRPGLIELRQARRRRKQRANHDPPQFKLSRSLDGKQRM